LTKAEEFWPLLDIQYCQNETVFFHHKPKLQPAELVTQFYNDYLAITTKAPNQMPFHYWLTRWLQRSQISYQTFGDIFKYKSNKVFFPHIRQTNEINSYNSNCRCKRSIGTAFTIGVAVIGIASMAVKSMINSIMLPTHYASKQDMLINAQRIEEL
jgi:hypothetical protein